MVWKYQQCTTIFTVLSMFYVIIAVFLTPTILYVFYKLICIQRDKTESKMNRRCGITFTLFIFLTLICSTIVFSGKCLGFPLNYYQINTILYYVSFGTSSLMLLFIFFVRIKRVFTGTPLQLAKRTVIIFYSVFIIIPSVSFIATIGYSFCMDNNCRIYAYIMQLCAWILLILIISTVVLFIYKLIQVYKTENNNEILINAITKITILFTMSICISFINLTTTVLYRYGANNIGLQWVFNYIALFDFYTNFICVIMSFKLFKIWYGRICSCFDNKCRICWTSIIVDKNGRKNPIEMLEKHAMDHQVRIDASSTKSTTTSGSNGDGGAKPIQI